MNEPELGASRVAPPTTTTALDHPEGTSRENRVRIVEPPSDREDSQPIKGILKRPTQKFPEDPNPVREGVKPLNQVRQPNKATNTAF